MIPSSVRARLPPALDCVLSRALSERAELGLELATVLDRAAQSGASDEQIALALGLVVSLSPSKPAFAAGDESGHRAAGSSPSLLRAPSQRYETGQSSRCDPESGPAGDGDDET